MRDGGPPAGTAPSEYLPDRSRRERTGLDEAVFCSAKSPAQIESILARHLADNDHLLLTRLGPDQFAALPRDQQMALDYDLVSRTAILGECPTAADATHAQSSAQVAVVTGGTSDVPIAREAIRTLAYHGCAATEINDIGVAGLWRLLGKLDELREYPVILAIAGMDAALPTVLGGQVRSVVIAVPTATGYGVAEGGRSALFSLLSSCAPGISVVNINNGYGAACAALRIVNALAHRPS